MSGPALTYTPNPGFCGIDTFSYSLSNAQFSDTAIVTIDVVCDVPAKTVPSRAPSVINTATANSLTADPSITGPILKLEGDFAEGKMNESLSISVLANDIIPSGR